MSCVRCHMSGFRCQVSGVRCQMSGVKCLVSYCVDLYCDLFPDRVAAVLTAAQLLTSCPLSSHCSGQTEMCRAWYAVQCCVPNPMKSNNSNSPSSTSLLFPLLFLLLLPYFYKSSPNLLQFWQQQSVIGGCKEEKDNVTFWTPLSWICPCSASIQTFLKLNLDI